MPPASHRTKLQAYIPTDIYEQLKQEAAAQRVTLSDLVAGKLLASYVDTSIATPQMMQELTVMRKLLEKIGELIIKQTRVAKDDAEDRPPIATHAQLYGTLR